MSKRAGIIPPRGSIPRGQLKAASERRSMQRQNSFDDTTSWTPHVIEKKRQKQSPQGRKDKERRGLEHILAQIKQEFDGLCTMAQAEGEKFDIGFVPYLSTLKKRIVDINAEIGKLQ